MMEVEVILFALVFTALVVACVYGLSAGIGVALLKISKVIHPASRPIPSLSPPEDQSRPLKDDAWTTGNTFVYDSDNLR